MRIRKISQTTPIETQVIDNLMTNSSTDALSAKQGKILRELLEGTILYNNGAGISTGTITLNESMTNYKRLVFYSNTGQFLGEQLMENVSSIPLQQNDQGSVNTMIRIARLNVVSNTQLTFYANMNAYFDGSAWRRSDSTVILGKIVGYKF